MGIQDRDWFRDRSGHRKSAGRYSVRWIAVLGGVFAVIAAIGFLGGLLLLFVFPIPILGLLAWIPAALFAALAYLLLKTTAPQPARSMGRVATRSSSERSDGTAAERPTSLLERLLATVGVILLAYWYDPFGLATKVQSYLLTAGDQNATASYRAESQWRSSRGSASERGTLANNQRRDWRGPDGEATLVYPNSAKPNGESVRLVNNPRATDPTYRQLVEFLRSDASDRRLYIPGRWVCACFAEEVHNNAEKAGWRCAWVSLDLGNGDLHACNLFRTSDRGFVYVDCTGHTSLNGPGSHDKIVEVAEGTEYVPKFLFPSPGWNVEVEPMGVVRSVEIDW